MVIRSLGADEFHDQEFFAEVATKVDEWVAEKPEDGATLLIPTRNSFFTMIVHEVARSKGETFYSESVGGGVEVHFVSKEKKAELIAARIKEVQSYHSLDGLIMSCPLIDVLPLQLQMRDELDRAIGFSKVIDVLSKSKKPVIGHNALLDFVYVFNQFYKPLPDTLAEFKAQLVELFPVIYDTKHVTLRSPLADKMKSTSLSALFEYVREHVKPTPENLLSPDERFDAYREALKAEADGKENLLCHEAGFDAFMTAVCFLGLLAHDAKGELIADDVLASAAHLDKQLGEMEAFKNQINLMISDERFLDLANPAQTIDRSRVYRVTSTTKRKIHQVRMEDVFQASKIHRVVRESEQEAFVVLSEPVSSDGLAAASSQNAGLSLATYDEVIAEREEKARVAKQEKDRQLFERLSSSGATFPALAKDAAEPEASSVWNRCTIS